MPERPRADIAKSKKPKPKPPSRPRADIAPAKKPPTKPPSRPRADIAKPKTEPKKKKKAVVKRKAPPIPVPSLTIDYENPPPKPKPQRIDPGQPQPKPKPHGGHVPVKYEQMNPLDWANTMLAGEFDDSVDRDRIKRQNQWAERDRRSTARADRTRLKQQQEARRAEVRKIDKKTREFIGRDRLQDYIKNGPQAQRPGLLRILKEASKGVLHSAEGAVGDFTTRLRGGIQQRPHEDISADDNALVNLAGMGLLGEDLVKALNGQEYDRNWLFADLALLVVPVKGLPTPLSALLRGVLGARRFALAEEKGWTVAQLAKRVGEAEFTKPVLTSRAERRAALRAEGAPRASSALAGKLAGNRTGPIATWIRNDPGTKRTLKLGGASVQTPADLSRTGKFIFRPFLDTIRRSEKGLHVLRSEEALYLKTLKRQTENRMGIEAGLWAKVAAALPQGALKNMDWPGIYAVRAVLKRIPLSEMVATTERSLAKAVEEGNALSEKALKHHLSYFKKAQKYVGTNDAGDVVLRDDAPAQLEKLRSAIEAVTDRREQILGDLDLLDEAAAKGRVLNEQLFYHGARLQSGDAAYDAAVAAHPVHNQISALADKVLGDDAEAAKVVLDAKARMYYEQEVAHAKSEAERLRAAVADNPSSPMAEAWTRSANRWESKSHTLSPAAFWDNIALVSSELPPEIILDESKLMGEFGKDWMFSIREMANPFVRTEKQAATNLKRYREVGPLEFKNERTFASGAVTDDTRAQLAAQDKRIDSVLKRLVDFEYQGKKADYDLSAGVTQGKPGGSRAVPKGTPMPRTRGGQVDIQRAGELAEPVEKTGKEYIGPSQSGRQLAEREVLRTIRSSDDETAREFVRLIDETEALRARVAHADEPSWMKSMPTRLEDIPIAGAITDPEMHARLLLTTPDIEQRLHDSQFYHMLDEVLGAVLDDPEIDKAINTMAWLTSQVGASPSRGLLDLQKVQQAIRLGEQIPLNGPGSIGLAAKTMEALLHGETTLSRGARAKISDFIDSALLKTTRSWLGDEPGIGPLVADRWGARATGLIDEGKEAGSAGVLVAKERWGIDLVPDVKGGLTEVQYEQVAKRYQQFVDYLNDLPGGFDGRKDWTGLEIQAMDWAAIQRFWGEEPEDLYKAIASNSRRVDFEITQGPSNLGAALSEEQVAQIAKDMEPQMRALAESTPGVKVGRIDVDYSGWAEGGNASVHMELFALEHSAQDVITKIAQAFDQELVQASRWITVSAGEYPSKAALIIEGEVLRDPKIKAEFFSRLAERHPEFEGHMPTPFSGRNPRPGFVSRTSKSNLSGADGKAEWAAKYDVSVAEIAADMGIAVDKPRADNLQLLVGSQYGPEAIATESGSIGGRTLRDLSRDSAAVRRDLSRQLRDAANAPPRLSVVEGASDDFRVYMAAQGRELGGRLPGYDEAIKQLERQEMPTDFIQALIDTVSLEHYEKLRLAAHLDQVSGGVLRGGEFPGIPGAKRYFPETLQLAGLWDETNRRLYFSENGSHAADWVHEIMHVSESEGLLPGELRADMFEFVGADRHAKKLTEQQAEDLVDMVEAMIIGFDPEKSSLPDSVKRGITTIQKSMKANERGFKRGHEMLEKMPEETRIRLEDLFHFQDNGIKFRGANVRFLARDGSYTPEMPGLPFGVLSGRRYTTLWSRMVQGARVNSLTETDKHLERQFTAALLDSGQWSRNVTDGPLEGLMKAQKMQRIHDTRQAILPAATDIPTYSDDIMIPLDPKEWTADMREKARGVFLVLDAMEQGRIVDGELLAKTDALGIEQIKDVYFPGLSDATEKAVADLAAVRMLTKEPIEGVVWIRRSILKDLGLFDSPGLRYTLGPKGAAALGVADFANNIAKMLTLSLNPAYYPMNMAGQAVMMMSQQGWMAPITMARALVAMRSYSDEQLAIIDRFSGSGWASVVGGVGKSIPSKATDAVSKVTDILIDRFPRRAAFLYEARRMGYKTVAEVIDLVENPKNIDDLMTIGHRTNNAMVDFGGMSKMEKELYTRLWFVYPWLKGSSKYALQFPFDHPIQAALFAGLLTWQQERLREAFPEGHPGYMKWFFPLKIGDPTTGERPYGFRLDQFMTPLQPADLAAEIVFWTSPFELPWGSNEEGIASHLNPLLEEITKTVTGWDSFAREEVSTNIIDFFRRLVSPEERWASWKRLKKVLDHDVNNGIYDTNQTQNWLRLFLGSIAPIDMNPEKAGELSKATRTINVPDPTPEEKVSDYMKQVEEANGGPLLSREAAAIQEWKQNDIVHGKVENKYLRDHDIDTATNLREKVEILFLTIAELYPEKKSIVDARLPAVAKASDEELQAAYDELREALGLSQLGTLNSRVSKAREAARTGGGDG